MARFAAFRFTADASPSQLVVLGRHAGAARFAFNQCLAMVKDALDAKGKTADGSVKVPWTGFDLINAFNGWKRSAAGRVWVVDSSEQATMHSTGLRWRGEVCQQVFEEAAVDCGRALTAFADSRKGKRRGARVGFPRFKRKTATTGSFRIRNKTTAGRAAIQVGDPVAGPRTICLPKIGIVRVREDTRRLRRMLRNGRATIRYVTVSRHAGRWTISVTVEAADLHPARRHPAREDGQRGWVGVDRGLTALVVAADGTGREILRVEPPRPLRTGLPRLRRLSRRVSRARCGSKNRSRAVARLARCHRRIRDVRAHALHEVANRLVKTHDRLVLEDLNTAGMVRNRRLARSISDAGWAELARMIGYKQQWAGGQVITAGRWFASSKTCSRCSAILAVLPLAQRMFTCAACGHVADRDLNAAANLAVWGEQHDAQTRDPEARGPVINALPRDGSDRRASARR
ncbi:MAG: IS200/IS605 family element transposase accessory protein TnpB [Hamadaea sp.]|uniref:RNA-guided endonuclease TnpB family protein n=1 Tax=Hamadaea sp. TaxID=2024425 RepID=UPI00185E25F3|nr:RNA-guided endonuclease TnpB family protein [Hamadaea sp.]NUR73817.1 IS200/IS605 family element transposase accessory protein TnpB [Hamadaea sp.]NUT21069.1 IS200/IS605 family element transposase accessory protein TnpB [Hamadaea sp.]